ncbi:DNA polymerase-3 subunit delta' [Robiginitalea myxolifaciens]|uniref:DNA polymerase-3 subunit delta n=1 Tax=Robiginitalea myxolifaciens TaxID=400055 RepID=A0A1I6G2Z3_9FLAO|nr:DNA polymerase III subunit delta' [Robiginitalea myxolifaciens]SFR36546.1 DNA polymerase-3 subunit delta' [Robiginitalea myxolifaciens]
MLFKEVLGHRNLHAHLTASADGGRIPHAQLFVGPEGSGTLPAAIAYAQYILCGNSGGENEGGAEACNLKCAQLTHPDLHFSFPVASSGSGSNHSVSNDFLKSWRDFVANQPYGNLFDWYQSMGIEKKQGQISVHEAADIVRKLSLKSFEGGYKVLIMWMAERMNNSAANKLLKLIEEPPAKTVIILIAEQEDLLLQTIRSRCQILHFPPLPEEVIVEGLMRKGGTREEAMQIAQEAQGNFNKAQDLLLQDSEDLIFEKWFIQWTRTAFKAKGNKASIHELILWSNEIGKTGRETQKKFLNYCLSVFRQALLLNYKANSLVYLRIHDESFQLKKFAPFVHEGNIQDIRDQLETAIYHVERNGNGKIIFTDLSINLTRLLHRPAA